MARGAGAAAIVGILIVAAILGFIFFANRNGQGLFGDAFGSGFTGGGGSGNYDTSTAPPTATQQQTQTNPQPDATANQTTARSSTPTIDARNAGVYSLQNPALSYDAVQAYQQQYGVVLDVTHSQGFGAPGIPGRVDVPLLAAFGFGGDAEGAGLRVNPVFHQPDYVVERRAGLRNEAIGNFPLFTQPPQAAEAAPRGRDARANRQFDDPGLGGDVPRQGNNQNTADVTRAPVAPTLAGLMQAGLPRVDLNAQLSARTREFVNQTPVAPIVPPAPADPLADYRRTHGGST